ncbi:TetR/AcrR family transcriptional regulator [Marinitenerispora sediminis]|uniref:TetR family transcriptional regulator n=1 Tax=Marinitenerispora sediminis TaxID=1931232 RepID=A0A368TB82_9ACTN|nr:TetR/AcrR family transcriptional regulator [Marinitenerispora sediminis]RCV54394.1 TetR family transcriptional regulator [Marinitenerispora sediminis]RCV61123.1 TetR family transcriptional regulator [Marinitenerispora sediminis]RCV62399.1 TetR family transcriptional regulator [Marinitenerispora sediminis]
MDNAERTVRVSHRGTATRNALLDAAARVFCTVGFARAGVSEVVAEAGASVGSLYHHFTGKADLFRALYTEFQQRQQQRTHDAAARARAAGETDPTRLMHAAARAYLEGCIEERETAWLFFSGDSPPGFDAAVRDELRAWTDRNVALFRKAEEPVEEALLMVVSGAMLLAVGEVVRREDRAAARRLADDVIEVLAGLEPLRKPPRSAGAPGLRQAGGDEQTD